MLQVSFASFRLIADEEKASSLSGRMLMTTSFFSMLPFSTCGLKKHVAIMLWVALVAFIFRTTRALLFDMLAADGDEARTLRVCVQTPV
jgi:hypothetical protein